MHTALLRHQHHEIIGIANDMRRHLLAPQRMQASVAESLSTNLQALCDKITSHLSIEDKGIYPKLIQSPNAIVASTAKRFSDEMVGLRAEFCSFRERWASGPAIHADPIHFVDECTTVFHNLTRRIDQEEKELYPLVDALP